MNIVFRLGNRILLENGLIKIPIFMNVIQLPNHTLLNVGTENDKNATSLDSTSFKVQISGIRCKVLINLNTNMINDPFESDLIKVDHSQGPGDIGMWEHINTTTDNQKENNIHEVNLEYYTWNREVKLSVDQMYESFFDIGIHENLSSLQNTISNPITLGKYTIGTIILADIQEPFDVSLGRIAVIIKHIESTESGYELIMKDSALLSGYEQDSNGQVVDPAQWYTMNRNYPLSWSDAVPDDDKLDSVGFITLPHLRSLVPTPSTPSSDNILVTKPFVIREGTALAGDMNGDESIDIGDIITLLNWMFPPATTPNNCMQSMDMNSDNIVDISDAVYILSHFFKGSSAPHGLRDPPFQVDPDTGLTIFPNCDLDELSGPVENDTVSFELRYKSSAGTTIDLDILLKTDPMGIMVGDESVTELDAFSLNINADMCDITTATVTVFAVNNGSGADFNPVNLSTSNFNTGVVVSLAPPLEQIPIENGELILATITVDNIVSGSTLSFVDTERVKNVVTINGGVSVYPIRKNWTPPLSTFLSKIISTFPDSNKEGYVVNGTKYRILILTDDDYKQLLTLPLPF